MARFSILPALVLLLSGVIQVGKVQANSDSDSKANRPNILFIMSDDHAYQAMSCYGSKVNVTPNLDRIANEGMRFDRCFVTNSICGPARAVILTGKYSHINGFTRNGDRFNGEQQNVAKLLQQAGYQTAVIGKWHLGTEPTGFDYWHVLQGQGPYYNPEMLTPDGKVAHTGYTTEVITDLTLQWLQEQRDPDQPFFLLYWHKAPHRNWQPGPDYLTKYDGEEIPEPETLFDDYEGRGSAAKQQTMTIAEHLNEHDLKLAPQRARFTDEQLKQWNEAYSEKNEAFREANLSGDDLVRWKYQRYVKDYLRCVDAVDDNVGRVLDYLEESGLDENTVVIYSSDQGWYLGEHGWYDKRWMYEESFRTPLLVRWPGQTNAASENTDLVVNVDFAATFLDIAGAEIPEDMQGQSIVPILKGETPDDWRESVYYHYYEFPGPHSVRRHLGVRTDRYKLIHFYRIDEWEMYDLEKDPHELNSVYDDPEYAAIVDELKTELRRLQEHYKDDGSVIDFGADKARAVETEQVIQFSPEETTAVAGAAVFARGSQGNLDPTYKPMVIGGWCRLDAADGVLVAQGGASLGYCLEVRGGVPQFSVRGSGDLNTVSGGGVATDAWTHVAATLDADGYGRLFVNGKPVGDRKKLGFVTGRPADGFSIGEDSGSLVMEDSQPLQGDIRDVRVYWGMPDEESFSLWTEGQRQTVLFNGRNLDGWRVIEEGVFDKHGEVKVKDGNIILAQGTPATGIVFAGDPPRLDYELSLQAKRLEGSDFFCGLTFPVHEDYLSLIVGGWGGGVTGISNLDGLAAVENETTGYTEFEDDRWYRIRLRVTGERIEAWIDDNSILGLKTENNKHSIWWEQEPARPLGIATWNTTAAIKDIQLTRLK